MRFISYIVGPRALVAVGTICVCASAGQVFAGNTWDGGGGDDLFGTGNNWNPDGAPSTSSTSDLFFAGTTRLTPNNNYGSFDDFRNVTFNSGAGAFTISGNAIDLFGNIENLSANAQTVSLSSIALNASLDFKPTNGDLTINSSNVFLNGNQLRVSGSGGKTLTFGSSTIISGSSGNSVAINGNSSVVLQSAHTYNGDTFINAGSLQFAAGGSASNSTIRLGDTSATGQSATLSIIDADGGTTVSSVVVVRPGSGGTKTISATNTSGTNTFSGNAFLDADVTTGIVGGGALAFTGSQFDLKNQTLTVGGAGNTTVSNPLSNSTGSGKLIKEGSGTLTLSNASNTYGGATTVRGGKLVVSGTLASGGGTVTVGNGSPGTGTLAGSGTINRAVTINDGGSVAPGTSVGTLNTGAQTWNGGGTYLWEINAITVAGSGETVDPGNAAGSGWDLINLGSSGLTVGADSSTPFTIQIVKLGAVAIDETNGQVWFTIAKSTSGSPSGFDASDFVLPALADQDWQIRSVSLGGGGFAVQVSPTPELGSASLFGTAAAALLLGRWRLPARRRPAAPAA